MFSTDNNIETIAQLVEQLKKHFSLEKEYLKYSLVDKTVRLFTVLTMTFILSVLFLMVMVFVSLIIAALLKPLVGAVLSYALVAALYSLLFLLCIVFRKSWIERPIVRVLANILME